MWVHETLSKSAKKLIHWSLDASDVPLSIQQVRIEWLKRSGFDRTKNANEKKETKIYFIRVRREIYEEVSFYL